MKKIQRSGYIANYTGKVPEISVNFLIDGIVITAAIVASDSDQSLLGLNDMSRFEERMRLAEREISEQLTDVTSECQHIFEFENTSDTILGEQSNNMTADMVKKLTSANKVQKIFEIEDIIGNNLLCKGFSIAEAIANSSDDKYGVDINAPKFIPRPTELSEAFKYEDQNIFKSEDIIGVRPFFEGTHGEISGIAKIKLIKLTHSGGPCIAGDERAEIDEFQNSLIKIGTLVECKDQSDEGQKKSSLLNTIKFGVENVEADYLS